MSSESVELDEERCPYFSTDIVTKRGRDRVDGWRCGEGAGHRGNHVLYSLDGEHVIYSASWGQRTPPALRCDTCGDTGQALWAVEADPNLYQEVDDDGMVPCIDCALPPETPTQAQP